MKIRPFIIGLLCVALSAMLSACHSPQREARQMVRRAERLFDTMPDSTARLIDSVLRMPVYFGERQRMDMALLQGEALFGDRDRDISPLMDDEFLDDKDRLTTSPELERAAAYYARKKQYAKAAHAALYSGFVQQHYGEKAAAMQSFKEVEQYGGKAGDNFAVAVSEYKMGKMLLQDGMYNEAMALASSANQKFGTHHYEKALAQNMIAVCYLLLEDYKNAESCLQQNLINVEGFHLDKVKPRILNNYAVLYHLQGKYEKAIKCLKQIAAIPNLDNLELLLFFINIGDIYVETQEMDSAAFYYKRVDSLLPQANVKKETKVAAYKSLSQFAENQGNDSLALCYWKHQDEWLNDIRDDRERNNVYGIQQKYDYESLQNSLNRKIILRHRIILIISILLFIAAIIILVLQFRHKQMMKAEKEMRQQIDNLKKELSQTVKPSYLEQELSSRLRLIISANRTQKQANDPKKEWNPIVIRLMNGKESVFEAVLEEIEKVYPGIYSILRQKCPELNESEMKVCLLSCSDLTNAEIADVLGLSLNTVNKNRSKVRNKLKLKPEKMKEQLHEVLVK